MGVEEIVSPYIRHIFSAADVARVLGVKTETLKTYIKDFRTPPHDVTFGGQYARGWYSLEPWLEWHSTPGSRGLKYNAKEYRG